MAETWFWCSLHESPHRDDMTDEDCLLVGPYFTCDEARDWGTSVRVDPEDKLVLYPADPTPPPETP